MAASGEGERRPSGYVFLVGHGLLVLGYIFFTVGFATDHWLNTALGHYGLWEACMNKLCQIAYPGDLDGWMEATRAMQTLALMCYLGGVLASLFVHCVTHTFPHPSTCRPLQGKTRLLEICTAVGSAFCLIGVSVYGGKGDPEGTLGYSFALSVFSLFLTAPGVVMVAITRNAINTFTSRVSPEQQSGGPYPQSSNDVAHPYGRGQHHPQHPGPDGVHGQGEAPAYPYGRDVLPFPGQHPLPYPMHPEEPAGPGNFGSMTMPEPGPIGGGGGAAGLGLPPRAQSRGPGRLPPISEVSPSAPLPDPTDIERPPSYLEAIGQTPS